MPPSFSHNFLWLAGLCCLLLVSQTKSYQKTGASGHNKNQEPSKCRDFASIITNISLSLLQKATHWPAQTNIVFSPMSISAAFTMLSLGAKGSTHKQILHGLRLDLLKMSEKEVHKCFQSLLHTLLQPNYQVQMLTGSSLFIDKHLNVADKFKEMITELYHSETISINFGNIQEARTRINRHMMMRSYGHILKAVEHLPMDTALALVNFICFDGIHNDQLQIQYTEEDEFLLDTGKVVLVPMLKCLGKLYLREDKNMSSWVLIQHYVGNVMAIFILPDLGKMQQLIENLSHEYLNNIQDDIQKRFVNLYLPKFTISATYDLETVMKTLGITQIFGSQANLSKVTKDAPVKLSKAVHKAVLGIEDNEIDTSELPAAHLLTENLTVMFNRPFLVIIKDQTFNIPLFIGKVGNPILQ